MLTRKRPARAVGIRAAGVRAAAVLAAAVMAVAGGLPVISAEAATAPHGYDISYPQCGGSFPAGGAFAIVGVDGGVAFSANPCLGTGHGPSELAWAYHVGAGPGLYANTGNPGPRVSAHWPTGQRTPKPCASGYPADDSTGCAYDYGWNAAAASFGNAVAAAQQVFGGHPPSVAADPWWLDVETSNSWETLEYGRTSADAANDTAAVQGELAYLHSRGVGAVGIYSTGSQWTAITGGARPGSPAWVAGASTLASAERACRDPAFTGGRVAITQYPLQGFDADYRCP